MPAKGQRLFVRPIAATDRESIAEFLAREAPGCQPPPEGLIGKLVGDLVAVAGTTLDDDEVVLDIVVVARELRRKRIGRVMIESLVASRAGGWLVARKEESTIAFLRRVGFSERGDSIARRIEPGTEKVGP
jgi:hypothetical protein